MASWFLCKSLFRSSVSDSSSQGCFSASSAVMRFEGSSTKSLEMRSWKESELVASESELELELMAAEKRYR